MCMYICNMYMMFCNREQGRHIREYKQGPSWFYEIFNKLDKPPIRPIKRRKKSKEQWVGGERGEKREKCFLQG